jgi:undecaprenyl-diphosphatase
MMMLGQWDSALFEAINTGMSHPFLDVCMPFIRQPYFWLPLYVFFIAFVLRNFGRRGYWLLLFTLLTVSTSDSISSRPVKQYFQRLRPCNTEQLHVIERVRCGSGFSFTSSHAANHFAIAAFLTLTLGRLFRRLPLWLFLWAATVGFAQVYVGVHFPGDILGGALLGLLIGVFWASLFRHFYGHTIEGMYEKAH